MAEGSLARHPETEPDGKPGISFICPGPIFPFKRLNLSKKYVPGYLEIERIQKEAQRIGEELGRKAGLKEGETKGKKEGLKEGKIEMAKKMKDKGTDIEFISEITGLSMEEIERLI